MAASDPASLVYDSIWATLEAKSAFTDLVKVGNRMKFNDSAPRDPMKREVLTEDKPEVRVVGLKSDMHLQSSSNSSFWDITYSIQIATGERRITRVLFPVMWAIYRAMADWPTTLAALTWNGKTFVHYAKPEDSSEGIDALLLNRGIVGWSSIWTYEVRLHFTTEDLRTV